ncbi:MAG TPA: ABC transporter permease [Bryobacteraceae bacterium]|nr:ABC transporter permease [Bryobacteraceae bacterium]
MSEARELWRRLRMLFHRRQFQEELEEEMRLHLELRAQEHVENGLSAEAARRTAYRRFGNPTVIRETSYMTWGWGWLESLVQDVRFALRQLWKTPGFTITAVLTLALGIGANAAIFTLVNAVLLKDLPVVDPQSLVRLGDSDQCCVNRGPEDNVNYSIHSTDTWQRFKQNNPEFEELAAMQAGLNPLVVRRDHSHEPAHSVNAEFVSGNYFRTFGLRAAAGRLLQDSDDVQGAPITAVMSYGLWERDYARDSSVVGSTFWINTKPVTIVGIAPEQFYGDRMQSTPPDIYLPIESMPGVRDKDYVHEPEARWLYLIGRVKPGTVLAPLRQKLSAQLRQIFATNKYFSNAHDRTLLDRVQVPLTPGGAGIQNMRAAYGSNLRLLQWIAGLVLLIACANVANLLLVRGMGRKAEMSLRTALGAARARIVRQLLTESLVLAVLGGIAALAVSYGGAELLLKLAFPASSDVPIHATPSLLVQGFALALSLGTGVLFGVAPAWLSVSAQTADALRSGSRTTGRASVLQRGLVVIQAALSLVLLVGAGLFAQSLSKLEHFDMKLDATNRYIIHFDPQSAGYSPAQLAALYQAIEDRFHQIPGMVKVGLSSYTPMEPYGDNESFRIQGQPDLHKTSSYIWANSEYFDSVGTRVVMGRGFGPQDIASAPAVAVVNQAFVKNYFKPAENPIGAHLGGTDSPGDFEIIGVVEDTTYGSVRWKDHSMLFLRLLQQTASAGKPADKATLHYVRAIVLETARPMNTMEALSRQTLSGINPDLSVVKFQTFRSQIGEQFTDARMLSRLMTLFGGLALLLAAVGLYGVTSYGVARRTSEIGIRMALGAERSGVVAMILRSALLQTMFGLAIGVPVAFYGVTLVKSQLYEMTTVSGGALAVALGILLAAACVAGLIPARRAASVDPARALRAE